MMNTYPQRRNSIPDTTANQFTAPASRTTREGALPQVSIQSDRARPTARRSPRPCRAFIRRPAPPTRAPPASAHCPARRRSQMREKHLQRPLGDRRNAVRPFDSETNGQRSLIASARKHARRRTKRSTLSDFSCGATRTDCDLSHVPEALRRHAREGLSPAGKRKRGTRKVRRKDNNQETLLSRSARGHTHPSRRTTTANTRRNKKARHLKSNKLQ